MARGLRIAVFASHYMGSAVLDVLLTQLRPHCQVVLIATDDPRLSHCNAARRLWSLGYDEDLLNAVTRRAARAEIPAFTGRICSEEFQSLFDQAKPDVLLCSCFGQLVPDCILNRFGPEGLRRAYNCHPTSPGQPLAATRGATAMQQLMRKGSYVDYCLHRMTCRLDDGEEVARSPAMRLPDSVLDGDHAPERVVECYRESAHLVAAMIQRDLLSVVAKDLASVSK